MSPIISPRELAIAIGVSESSLKRWADDGLIQVSKTAGGHRRISIGEAIRFIRATRSPLIRPEAIGMAELKGVVDAIYSADDPSARLYALLREGKTAETWGLIASLYLSGQSVAEIGDGPIRFAMKNLGELWEHGDAGIFIEHRATTICCHAIERLLALLDPPDSSFCAVGGGVIGDPYMLSPLLASTVLVSEGIVTINLGPDTPASAMLAAFVEHAPRLMWLCVSSIHDVREVEQEIATLASRLSHDGCLLAIGGRASTELQTPKMPNVRLGHTLSDLATIARDLKTTSPQPKGKR